MLEDGRKREELAQYCLDQAEDELERAKDAATSIGSTSAAGAGQNAIELVRKVELAAESATYAQEMLTLARRARETLERSYDDARLWHFGAGLSGGTAIAAGGRAYTDFGVQAVYRLSLGFELLARFTATGLADDDLPQRLTGRGLMAFSDAAGWAFVAGLGTAFSTENERRQPLALLTPFGIRYRWGNTLAENDAVAFAELGLEVEPWIVSRGSEVLPESALFISVRAALGLASDRASTNTQGLCFGPERATRLKRCNDAKRDK